MKFNEVLETQPGPELDRIIQKHVMAASSVARYSSDSNLADAVRVKVNKSGKLFYIAEINFKYDDKTKEEICSAVVRSRYGGNLVTAIKGKTYAEVICKAGFYVMIKTRDD